MQVAGADNRAPLAGTAHFDETINNITDSTTIAALTIILLIAFNRALRIPMHTATSGGAARDTQA